MVLYPFVSGSTTDFAFGLDLDVLWSSVPSSTQSFKWYAATTNIATLDGSGNLSATGQVQSVKAGSATTGDGQLYLNGATSNRIDFNTNGSAAPAFTARSAGTKIVLNPTVAGAAVDYGLGVETSSLWMSVATSASTFKFYAGNTNVATITGTGGYVGIGSINSTSPTAGIGYAAGAGGTVTQLTSKSTGVTLNKVCGTITTSSATLAAGAVVTFTVTNSVVSSTDIPVVNAITGTNGGYSTSVSGVISGAFDISIRNLTAGSLSEAIQIRFAIFNSVNA
jgi:hypothetical protein